MKLLSAILIFLGMAGCVGGPVQGDAPIYRPGIYPWGDPWSYPAGSLREPWYDPWAYERAQEHRRVHRDLRREHQADHREREIRHREAHEQPMTKPEHRELHKGLHREHRTEHRQLENTHHQKHRRLGDPAHSLDR